MEHLQIDKRDSVYRSETVSQLLVLQNILGYGRIEKSRRLDQDMILKAKLGLERYPDPETFRDELEKYTEENIGQLFLVNEDLLHVLTLVAGPQEVDLHYDAKVITVYGDQEKAEVGYNPHKNGRSKGVKGSSLLLTLSQGEGLRPLAHHPVLGDQGFHSFRNTAHATVLVYRECLRTGVSFRVARRSPFSR